MKTPKEYLKNLKNGIITDQMISDILFSYSKRAKNYRDNARELRRMLRESRRHHFFGWYDDHNDIEKNEFRKEVLYDRKSDILSKFEDRFLKCIHKQDKHAIRRVYDYESDYVHLSESDEVIWSNCYFDDDECREVWFVDVPKKHKEYLYFLYYEFPDRSFHTPIDKDVAEKYVRDKKLDVIELDELVTFGEDVGRLLSLQFCDKVYKFLFPDKTIYNISQPICVVHSKLAGAECRFYSDDEIKNYKEERERKRQEAEVEKLRRREERKKETEERRRLKKIEDAKHKEDLKDLLKVRKVDDWNVIKEVIHHDDKIFDKIYKKLPEEQRENIRESCWKSYVSEYDGSQFEKLYKVIENSPDCLKDIMHSITNFVSVNEIIDNTRYGLVCGDFSDKGNDAFRNMVETMVAYNGGLTKTDGHIHFVKNNKNWICFCHVPMFGNIYVEPKFGWNTVMKEVFKSIPDKKAFNRSYQSFFTIKHRTHNRINVGYDKFCKEVKKLNLEYQQNQS